MNKPQLKIILLTLICLSALQVQAQKPKLRFKSIKASDGLINSTVQAVYEDSFGFIWLGTQHGVQRYNGRSFTNFTIENSDSIGLSHNYINDFCEDGNGDIWIATSIGLNRYSRVKDRIFQYHWKGVDEEQVDDIQVIKVISDEKEAGVLWMTSDKSRLIKLNTTSGVSNTFKLPGDNIPLVLKSLKSDFYPNHLLVGTTELYLFNKDNEEFKEVYSLEQSNDVFDNRFNDLVIDPNDQNVVWCATGDLWGRGTLGGLLKFNLETGESRYLTRINRPGEIPDRHILTVCFSDPGKLWVGTRNFGVLLYDIPQDRFYNYRYNEYDEGSFVTENAIRAMYVDRSGTCWFGSWGDGISLLSPANQKFTHYKHLPNVNSGLISNWITGITEDKDGNIWIGTKADGLAKFDPVSKTFENHFREYTRSENPLEITYVFYDSRDNLWIGTYANALYRYNPVTGQKVHYPQGNTVHSVSQKRISAIAELIPGEILISTYGGGLNIYKYDTDSFRRYLNNPKDSTSIPDNQIWLPFLGDDGNYYMGGNSKAGLIKFDPRTEKFSEPLSWFNLETFLNPIEDSQGRMFIDPSSMGFSELILQDTILIRPLTDKQGNRIVGTESAVLDKMDNIWMGTNNGLVKYNPDTRELKRYTPDEGLQGYSFYRYAAYASSRGTIYFGGLNGLNSFNPEEIRLSDYQPPVVLTGFKLFQENLQIGEDSPLKKNILLTDKIELGHKENDFSISFSGLDYSNPDKIQYKYQLLNHDEDWINAGNNSSAGYTNMDPGTYTFMVKSTNADGVWNDKTTSLEVIIDPPWWHTTAAYLGYVILLILGIAGVDRFQRKRLREKQQAQARERELAQAKEIEKAYNKLEMAHENLKATQAQLIQSEKMASLGELTAGIAHEIQNPLNFVNNFSDVSVDLLEEMHEEVEAGHDEEFSSIMEDLKQNLQKIHHHGKRASGIVRGMLEHSRSGNGQKEPTDINLLADEYLRLAYHGLRAKDKSFNADFNLEADKDLPKIKVVGQDIGRVLLNLINNAFYAVSDKAKDRLEGFRPSVRLITKSLDDKIEITVKDNGKGISDRILEKIFQPFYTTKPSGEGTGLGLSLSYDIITKGHGGELKVKTDEGEGTEFIITLPVT